MYLWVANTKEFLFILVCLVSLTATVNHVVLQYLDIFGLMVKNVGEMFVCGSTFISFNTGLRPYSKRYYLISPL